MQTHASTRSRSHRRRRCRGKMNRSGRVMETPPPPPQQQQQQQQRKDVEEGKERWRGRR